MDLKVFLVHFYLKHCFGKQRLIVGLVDSLLPITGVT